MNPHEPANFEAEANIISQPLRVGVLFLDIECIPPEGSTRTPAFYSMFVTF